MLGKWSTDARRSRGGSSGEVEQQVLGELERDLIESERLRSLVLMIFCVLNLTLFLLAARFLTPHIELFRQAPGISVRVACCNGLLLLYEIVMWRTFSRLLVQQRAVRWLYPWQLLSSVLELAFPTVLVYSAMKLTHPVYGLYMPPATLFYMFILLSTLRFDLWISLVTGLASGGLYLYLFWLAGSMPLPRPAELLLATASHHWVRASTFVAIGMLTGFLTVLFKRRVLRSIRLVAERNRIRTMFGLYVSPAVVDRLIDQPMLPEGEVRPLCVMFLDIRNFTTFSEKLPPQEVVRYLNTLFAFMIDCVTQHGGMINKFLGDGFMAIFGAPFADGKECARAIAAAQQILTELNQKVLNGELPATRVGIGLHQGPALVGTIGSHKRKEFTVIGDTVNVAARIEQLCKQHQAQLLVSQCVLAELPAPPTQMERIGEVTLRGKEAPLLLYKLA